MTSLSKAGRKRSDKARQAILKATLALLDEKGFSGLAVEAVAARAGVGKATIYRWWKSKAALAMEAFMEGVSDEVSFSPSESACEDIRDQLIKIVALYHGHAGRILCEVVALGQSEPDVLTSLETEYLDRRREKVNGLLDRAIAQKEIRPDIDKDVVVEALYAPIFCKMLMRLRRFDKEYISAHFDLIMQAIRL
ncbi:TetR/AcrR family transcriptional regulator [Zymobacter sp. IVIA_12111.31 C1]|uniref:TetR/AcrR family transcriptional regulator n=1 Tax=Zymobacter sp. IVIA_12111.31 C1 TaxID=3394854 RepID=UPI0039C490A9